MNCNGCTDCRQGRDCLGSFNASRAALGLPPLHRDVSDEPVYTAESVTASIPGWLTCLGFIAVAVCMAIACGACDPLFPKI